MAWGALVFQWLHCDACRDVLQNRAAPQSRIPLFRVAQIARRQKQKPAAGMPLRAFVFLSSALLVPGLCAAGLRARVCVWLQRTMQGSFGSNFQFGTRYCIAIASSRAPSAFSL